LSVVSLRDVGSSTTPGAIERRVEVSDWLLSADERGNPDTAIDQRHGDVAWTDGNEVTPLPHGRTYFDALCAAIGECRRGDLIMFTDWRGDPDEALDDSGTAVSDVLCKAAERGAIVKGLIWRSHLDVLRFSSAENRRLGAEIEAAGGECLLDMRVRPGGSHHQKMVVIRHVDRPDQDVAFVGGIDLCHSRRDDAEHDGDDQSAPMPDVFGPTPPWHDIQLAVRGPAVGDVELTFRERWYDPRWLTHNPVRLIAGLFEREDLKADPMPSQLPDPRPRGKQTIQVLRTYPFRFNGYPFARRGERSIARAYAKVLQRCQSLIYLEDQYLWSRRVAELFAAALRGAPDLRLIAVVPLHPDNDGLGGDAQILGRDDALRLLHEAGGDRVAVYGLENRANTPVYVHAKVCVVDDVWSCVGSDNLNMRSWTHDSEVACAVMDADGGTDFGRSLRLRLHREHLDRAAGDDADLITADGLFAAYRASADTLDAWHRAGDGTPRPPGRLRAYQHRQLSRGRRMLCRPMYHLICDPDGRPPGMRRGDTF
jgi:phosphatidylserine/phosphatidylglycerophosphate/cardiolipin synthase-like enzyme